MRECRRRKRRRRGCVCATDGTHLKQNDNGKAAGDDTHELHDVLIVHLRLRVMDGVMRDEESNPPSLLPPLLPPSPSASATPHHDGKCAEDVVLFVLAGFLEQLAQNSDFCESGQPRVESGEDERGRERRDERELWFTPPLPSLLPVEELTFHEQGAKRPACALLPPFRREPWMRTDARFTSRGAFLSPTLSPSRSRSCSSLVKSCPLLPPPPILLLLRPLVLAAARCVDVSPHSRAETAGWCFLLPPWWCSRTLEIGKQGEREDATRTPQREHALTKMAISWWGGWRVWKKKTPPKKGDGKNDQKGAEGVSSRTSSR